jgi:hypothetical protein
MARFGGLLCPPYDTAVLLRSKNASNCSTEYSNSGLRRYPMRWIALFVVPLLSITVTVRKAHAQAQQDPQALTVFQSSISAMGGSSQWASIQDWTITGTLTATGSSQSSSTFNWIGSGLEFRLERDTSSTTSVFVSGHGSPAWLRNGNQTAIKEYVARANPPFYLPGVLLSLELSNQALTIHYVGPTLLNGTSAIQVHVCDNSDAQGTLVTPHDWFFDPTSFLPLQVQFRLPPNENPSSYINGTMTFSAFQQVASLLVPKKIVLSKSPTPTESFVLRSIVFNSGVPQSMFNSVQGGGQ